MGKAQNEFINGSTNMVASVAYAILFPYDEIAMSSFEGSEDTTNIFQRVYVISEFSTEEIFLVKAQKLLCLKKIYPIGWLHVKILQSTSLL